MIEIQQNEYIKTDRFDTAMSRIDQQFRDLMATVGGVAITIDGLTTTVDSLATRVDGLTTRVDGLATTFDSLTSTVDSLVTRVDGLTNAVRDLTVVTNGLVAVTNGLVVVTDGLVAVTNILVKDVHQLKITVGAFDGRFAEIKQFMMDGFNTLDKKIDFVDEQSERRFAVLSLKIEEFSMV